MYKFFRGKIRSIKYFRHTAVYVYKYSCFKCYLQINPHSFQKMRHFFPRTIEKINFNLNAFSYTVSVTRTKEPYKVILKYILCAVLNFAIHFHMNLFILILTVHGSANWNICCKLNLSLPLYYPRINYLHVKHTYTRIL